jgi:hypothetical protein
MSAAEEREIPKQPAPVLLAILLGPLLLWFFCISSIGWEKWKVLGADEGFELQKAAIYLDHPLDAKRLWNDQPALSSRLIASVFGIIGLKADVIRYAVSCVFSLGLLSMLWQLRNVVPWMVALTLPLFALSYPGLLLLQSSVMLEPLACGTSLVAGMVYWESVKARKVWISACAGVIAAIAVNIKFTAIIGLAPIVGVTLVRLLDKESLPRYSRTTLCRIAGVFGVLFGMLSISTFIACGNDLHVMLTSHFGSYKESISHIPLIRFSAWSALVESPMCIIGSVAGIIIAKKRQNMLDWYIVWVVAIMCAIVVFSIYSVWWDYYKLYFAVPLMAMAIPGYGMLWDEARAQAVAWTGTRKVALLASAGMILLGGILLASVRVFEESKSMAVNDRLVSEQLLTLLRSRRERINYMFTDRPILAFHARLRTPPEITILPAKRFWSGQLTSTQMVAIAAQYRPEIIHISRESDRDIRAWTNLLSSGYVKVFEDSAGQAWAKGELGVPTLNARNDLETLRRFKL